MQDGTILLHQGFHVPVKKLLHQLPTQSRWEFHPHLILWFHLPHGFTFNPEKYPISEGVVLHPCESYTFPIEISVPSTMKSGNKKICFSIADTILTKTGQVIIRFGETLAKNVIVVTPIAPVVSSVMKGVVKIPAPSTTFTSISTGYDPRQFTTTIPSPMVNRTAILAYTFIANPPAMTDYLPGISGDIVNTKVIRNSNARPAFYG